MRRLIATMVGAIALMAGGGASAQTIAWKVADRYRLFDQADPAARARVEHLLVTLGKTPGGGAEGVIRSHYDLVLKTLAGPEASSLRRSNWAWARATGDADLRRYSPDYLYPKQYRVEARLENPPVEGPCRWRVGAEPAGVEQPCAQPVLLTVPAGQRQGGWGTDTTITVTAGEGPAVSTPVAITDRLVVALGDSFISGEGNPDQPSAISPNIPAGPAFQRPDWLGTKAAEPYVTPAEWWDEPCHRSLLSWPVLATLLEASRNEHAVVTLAHLGCSGAEGPDGLYKPQRKLPGGGDERASQADQLKALLDARAEPRRIDKVLLSLGGNDVGFAPVIAYAFIPPNGYGLGPLDVVPAALNGLVGGVVRPYRKDRLPLSAIGIWRKPAEARFEALPGRLAETKRTLEVGLKVPSGDIIHVKYPDILHDETGDFCRTALNDRDLAQLRERDEAQARREAKFQLRHRDDTRGGFEAAAYQLPGFAKWKQTWNFQFQYTPEREGPEPCDPRTARGEESEVCKAHWVWSHLNDEVARSKEARGWTVVGDQVAATTGHGWCVSPKDSLSMPISVLQDGRYVWAVHDHGDGWLPASPAAFDPYDPDLGRWFRTTNDSARSQYASRKRMHQGTIHPTFNTHIAYAEAVADAVFPAPATDSAATGR